MNSFLMFSMWFLTVCDWLALFTWLLLTTDSVADDGFAIGSGGSGCLATDGVVVL